MKYIIKRQFSFNNEKFHITNGSKSICKVKLTPSKEYKNQFNIKLSNRINKHIGEDTCLIEPDPKQAQKYLIYLKNNEKNTKTLFGQLIYQSCSYDNYLYTIIIGQKLYKVRSCDLNNRGLAIIDAVKENNSSNKNQDSKVAFPQTLFQVFDSFSKSTKKYHVTIHDKECQLGYLAISILLDLHECK